MNFKNFLVLMSVVILSFTTVGCEHDDDDDASSVILATNSTDTVSHKDDSRTTPQSSTVTDTSSSGGGGGGGGPVSYSVSIVNNSSHTVTINGTAVASGGGLPSVNNNGAVTVSYDTLLGYNASVSVPAGGNYIVSVFDSTGVPGSVEASVNPI